MLISNNVCTGNQYVIALICRTAEKGNRGTKDTKKAKQISQ